MGRRGTAEGNDLSVSLNIPPFKSFSNSQRCLHPLPHFLDHLPIHLVLGLLQQSHVLPADLPLVRHFYVLPRPQHVLFPIHNLVESGSVSPLSEGEQVARYSDHSINYLSQVVKAVQRHSSPLGKSPNNQFPIRVVFLELAMAVFNDGLQYSD